MTLGAILSMLSAITQAQTSPAVSEQMELVGRLRGLANELGNERADAALARAITLMERGSTPARFRQNLLQARRTLSRAHEGAPQDPRAALASAALMSSLFKDYSGETLARREREFMTPLEQELRQALDAAHRSSSPSTFLGRLVLEHALVTAILGDHRSAISELAASTRGADAIASNTFRRFADFAATRGDFESAEHALAEAQRHAIDDREIVRELAAILMMRGHPERAFDILSRALERYPLDAGIRRDLAGAQLQRGHAPHALSILERLEGQHPQDSSLHLAVAKAALEAGDPEKAKRAAERAAAASEEDPEAALTIAVACAALRDSVCEESAYRRALAIDHENARALEGLRRLTDATATQD